MPRLLNGSEKYNLHCRLGFSATTLYLRCSLLEPDSTWRVGTYTEGDMSQPLNLLTTQVLGHRMPQRDHNSLLNTKEAADFLGISPKTLANARVNGTSPPYVKAFGVRYRYCDLLAYVAKRVRTSTTPVDLPEVPSTPPGPLSVALQKPDPG